MRDFVYKRNKAPYSVLPMRNAFLITENGEFVGLNRFRVLTLAMADVIEGD